MHSMTIAKMIVVAWCLSVVLADMSARRIPNILTLGMCMIALCWLVVTGHSMLDTDIRSVIFGAAVRLLLTLPAYAANLLGAGDVKLLLAIALLGGGYIASLSFVIAAFLTLLFGIIYLLFARLRARPITRKKWLPFGAALSVGLLIALGVAK